MTLVEIIRLSALVAALLYGLSLIGFVPPVLYRYKKTLMWLGIAGAVLVVFGEPAWRGWQQYQAWVGDIKTVGLLSEDPSYIYFYSFGRFAAWRWTGAVAAAIIYWLSIRFVVQPSEGFKLSRDEALLIAIGIALAGWPGFVLYLIALLILYVGILAVRTAGSGGAARFSVALPATLALTAIPFIQQLLVFLSNTFEINFLLYNVTNLSL